MRSLSPLAILLVLSFTVSMAADEESRLLGPPIEPARPTFTFGGDALLRFEAAANFEVAGQSIEEGLRPERSLTRVRPTVTLRPARGIALFAQGQWYGAQGPSGDGEASLYQAYADLGRGPLTMRAGRQEIVLGSGFLLGADSFYDGASFDAVRVTHGVHHNVTLDAFGGRYVRENSGGIEGSLYGASVRVGDPEARVVEAYALRDTGDALATNTFALRAMLVRGPFRIELEPSRQQGRIALDQGGHSAWGGHAEVTYVLKRFENEPSFTASYAFASGEFRHPNNDTGQVGDIGLFGDLSRLETGEGKASGISAIAVNADFPLRAHTRLSSTLHTFRAEAVTGASSRSLGRELNLVLTRNVSEHLSISASANRFHGGGFFRDLRILYGYAGIELAF
jgi:hypothetical protein